MKKRMMTLVLATLMVLSLAACGGETANDSAAGGNDTPSDAEPEVKEEETASASGEIKVGFAQCEVTNNWRTVQTQSIVDEAEKRGIELIVTYGDNDVAQQVSNIEDMLAQGIDYLLLVPREYDGFEGILAECKAADVPVIIIDRECAGTVGEDFATVVISDLYNEAYRCGTFIADALDGKGNIAEITLTAGSSAAQMFSEGFADAIAEYPDLKIVATQDGDGIRATAMSAMENILQAQGNNVDAIYAHTGDMAIGCAQACRTAGLELEDMSIAAISGGNEALQAIVDGNMDYMVECDPYFGPTAFDIIEKLENGEQVEERYLNEDPDFDASNAEENLGTLY